MLIDIHTHSDKKNNHLSFVVGKHSLGIHPWDLQAPFLENAVKEKFEELKSQYHSQILAIGECGLDRRREGIADINEQERVLEWHMDWALEVGRPLIIHCVRAHSDLLKLLKIKNYRGKILLHDYAGNLDEANSFLSYDSYFSFGKRLFKEDQKTAAVMSSLPKERIFLETDDQSDFSLSDIYDQACDILGLAEKECEKLFFDNLKRFFLDLNDVSSSDVINYLSAR